MNEKPVIDRGGEALAMLLQLQDVASVLDVGSGRGVHAGILRASGRAVTTLSMEPPADYVGDFLGWPSDKTDFDAVWACHVLEHQVDPGAFLRECRRRLRPGGWLAVTVPPLKQAIVGGHVTLWNAGLLLYHLVLAGFDCRQARVGTYGYNISVLVQNTPAELPQLRRDGGDIAAIAEFFPVKVSDGFNGELADVRWPAGPRPVPRHVSIVGLGPSAQQYVHVTRALGGRHKFCDETWVINAFGDILACDRIFHMDDVRIQEIRAAAAPDSNIASMLAWLKTHPGPIITSRAHPDYPGLVEFPLAEVLDVFPKAYFNSTAAYAVAYALHLGVKKLSVFGCDFTYPNAHDAEKGRACVEYWLGMAVARGVELGVAKTSSLLDACHSQAERFYGYDTLDLAITRGTDGRIAVARTPRTVLPTAEEMEDRYDHEKHPSPLMKEVPAAANASDAAVQPEKAA